RRGGYLRGRGGDGHPGRARRAARRVGLPPRPPGAGSRRPRAAGRHPGRLPGRLRGAGPPGVHGRRDREHACLRPDLAALARGGRRAAAAAARGIRARAAGAGVGAGDRRAGGRARACTARTARPRRGRAHRPRAAGNGVSPPLLLRRPRVEAEAIDVLDDAALVATSYSTDGLALRDPAARDGPLAAVAAELAGWQRQGARLVVVATGAAQRERIRELLAGHDVDAVPSAEPFPQSVATPGRKPLALVGGLTRGVWLPADALALVTEAEIFGERRQIRSGRRERPADFLSALAALKTDGYVVL